MTNCPSCQQSNPPDATVCSACSGQLPNSDGKPTKQGSVRLVGKVLNGKYQVLSLLGEGGMGVVYKVRHLILQSKNLFALKILHPSFSQDSRFRARFLREVELAMELTHENIVQIRDFGMTEEGLLFFTMDYFEGQSLREFLDQSGRLPPARAVRIATQVLAALKEAHKCNIVHRDLKPDNVLIDSASNRSDRVRILDFGIAKLTTDSGESNLTQGAVIGSPKYMSPEQASAEKVDPRSDLYAVGVILYEMLTGKVPFSGKTTRMILMQHLTSEVPSFEAVCPGIQVPSRLEKLVFRLLQKDAEKRPASAQEVLDILDGNATVLAAPVGASRRGGLYKVGAVAAVLLSLAGAAWFAMTQWGAQGRMPQVGAQGARENETAAPAVIDAPSSEQPGGESPPQSQARRRLRCRVCDRVFLENELEGNMHHDLPLAPAE